MMTNDFLRKRESTPIPIPSIPIVIIRGRAGGLETIWYNAMLFMMKDRRKPSHIPITKSPALGKYRVRYPARMLVTTEMIITEEVIYLETPGWKITRPSTIVSTKKAARVPSRRRVTR